MSVIDSSAAMLDLPDAQDEQRAIRRAMLVVFIMALLFRGLWGGYRLAQGSPHALEFDDEKQYWMMANSLLAGDGLVDELGFKATRMPAYPGFLALFAGVPNGIAFAKIAQWVIGAVGAALVVGIGATLFGKQIGIVAGLLVAADPFLIFFSSLLLTETGFVVLICGFYWLMASFVRSGSSTLLRWIGAGVLAAVCVFQRESSLGLVVAAMGVVVLGRHFARREVVGAAMATLIIVLALIPWANRNRQTIGDWCWLTTRGGISLYDGVGPSASGASDLGDIKQMAAVKDLSEVEWNAYFLAESKKAIQSDPARIARLAATKMNRMWNPFPNVASYQSSLFRVVSAVWVVPTMILSFVGVVVLFRSTEQGGARIVLLLLLPALYLSVLHCFFVGSIRYRLGALPFLHVLGAVGLVATMRCFSRSKAEGGQAIA